MVTQIVMTQEEANRLPRLIITELFAAAKNSNIEISLKENGKEIDNPHLCMVGLAIAAMDRLKQR